MRIALALAESLGAVVVVFAAITAVLFCSGWVTISPERSSRWRRREVDWVCPRCEAWGAVFVSRLWRERARRHALGVLHHRLSPECEAAGSELVVLA